MAVLPCSMLYLSMTCLVCLQITGACESDRRCPGSKRCCNGICRFSCTCISSSDCDWDEKCCADQTCIDALDMCPQRIPVYVIAIYGSVFCGVCSVPLPCACMLQGSQLPLASTPYCMEKMTWSERHASTITFHDISKDKLNPGAGFSWHATSVKFFSVVLFASVINGQSSEIYKFYRSKNMSTTNLFPSQMIFNYSRKQTLISQINYS